MEILFFTIGLLVAGAVNVACFVLGAKISQQVAKGETVKLPKPVVETKKSRRQQREQEENDRERKWREAVLANIERYDGTSEGQQDVTV